MDPVTIIGICGTAAKLISKISSGVNGVLDAPKSVQALSNELSAVYLALGQLRILVENPSIREHHKFESWANSFQSVLGGCEDASRKLKQWWRSHQQDAIDEKVRAVLAAMKELHQDQAHTDKEHVVLAKGHSGYASTDLRLFDTRDQKKSPENSRVEELESTLWDLKSVNRKLKEDLKSSKGLSAQVEELTATLQKSETKIQELKAEIKTLKITSSQMIELKSALEKSEEETLQLKEEIESLRLVNAQIESPKIKSGNSEIEG
ncbi:hypothetical protein BDZ45DRAFT_800662 [Acephala macrosclerotiorum]|nr:hypothetical protein BDZ45DRAFT_800662 [Acephala macrosclerotiorum]